MSFLLALVLLIPQGGVSDDSTDAEPVGSSVLVDPASSSQVVSIMERRRLMLSPDRKRPEWATRLSVLSTAVPLGVGYVIQQIDIRTQDGPDTEDRAGVWIGGILALGGVFIGPSVGNFYAEDYLRGFVGIGARVVGTAIGVPGGFVLVGGLWEEDYLQAAAGFAMTVIGGGTANASVVWNIVTASDSAQEYNREHGVAVSVTPRLDPATGQAGATLSVRF